MVSWKKLVSAFMLIVVLTLSACSPTPQPVVPTAAPTEDLGAVRTQAAQTVVAQITADALANPSATPTQAPTATETPVPPTNTPTVAPSVTAVSTSTKAPSGSSGGGSSGSVYPTATGSYSNQATYVTQSPADGKYMQPGEDFDAKWTFKNTGRLDWNTHFYIKYQSGNLKPKNDTYMLDQTVKVNETHTFIADFTAPSNPGRYTSNWVLYDDNGTIIFHMYIVINVQ